MIGAIVGDTAGSRFEFCNLKSKEVVLLATVDDIIYPLAGLKENR